MAQSEKESQYVDPAIKLTYFGTKLLVEYPGGGKKWCNASDWPEWCRLGWNKVIDWSQFDKPRGAAK